MNSDPTSTAQSVSHGASGVPSTPVSPPIYLCGMPGSGKSTIGRLLADRLGFALLDTDKEIERRTGRTIASLFSEGEKTFRRIEREVVESTFELRGHVVSLGGGSLGDERFAGELRSRGTLVFIDVDVSLLSKRIRFTGDRPLLGPGSGEDPVNRLQTLATRRRPLYLMAQHHVRVESEEPATRTVERVRKAVTSPSPTRVHSAAETPWVVGRGTSTGNILERPYALVIDERVAALHQEWTERFRQRNPGCKALIEVPSGEASKSHDHWYRITGELLRAGMRRSDVVVAVGGGVTGDLAGFTASTLLRGVDLVHVPTTLLAMVDSSLGGKTGINHETGKNLIGTFYPARRIVIDTDFLATLPHAEWVNGFAEVLKYAYIADPALFGPLSEAARPELPQSTLEHLITRSCQIKTDIVARDEHEAGVRMHLNFGHTFAHALEHRLGYGAISHGTAVLVGMCCAAYLSRKLGGQADPEPIVPFLRVSGTRALVSRLREGGVDRFIDELMEAMGRDKKNRSSRLRLVLLEEHGRPIVREHDRMEDVAEAWRAGFEMVLKQSDAR